MYSKSCCALSRFYLIIFALIARTLRGNPFKLTEDKRKFLFEFCNFVVRFSVYNEKQVKLLLTFNPGYVSVNRPPNNSALKTTNY